jgi:hypothetical protein
LGLASFEKFHHHIDFLVILAVKQWPCNFHGAGVSQHIQSSGFFLKKIKTKQRGIAFHEEFSLAGIYQEGLADGRTCEWVKGLYGNHFFEKCGKALFKVMGKLLIDWHGLKISNSSGSCADLDYSITAKYTSDFQGKKTVEYCVFNGSGIMNKVLICMTNSMEEQR